MSKKYALIPAESIEWNKKTLYRIVALKNFGDVKRGDIGGFIEKEENLSHEGDCWIYDNAKVYDSAKVYDNALIYDNAEIFGNAIVYCNSKIYDNAEIYDNAMICGFAKICDNAKIYNNANIYGNAIICNNTEICEDMEIYDTIEIKDLETTDNNFNETKVKNTKIALNFIESLKNKSQWEEVKKIIDNFFE